MLVGKLSFDESISVMFYLFVMQSRIEWRINELILYTGRLIGSDNIASQSDLIYSKQSAHHLPITDQIAERQHTTTKRDT